MINKVLSTVRQYNMIENGDRVCVALSGGADSVALLHILLSLKDSLGITVCAAHLNHLLRGDESFRDEQFVRDLCDKLNVELIVGRQDVAAVADESGESIELAARKVRYDFFKQSFEGKIATAHTASDNAETVLINMTRGTGIKGMCGIPAVRDSYIRPLIGCDRREIENYCILHSLEFVTDSSNLTDDYTRNKLRHNVIPILRDINPSFDATARRMCETLCDDSDFLEKYADELYNAHKKDGGIVIEENIHKAISARLILRFVREFTGRLPDNMHTNEILSSLGSNKQLELFGGYFAVIRGRQVFLRRSDRESIKYTVNTTIVSRENFDTMLKINKLLLNNAVDCDKISGVLQIRARSEGDLIKLRGRGCTKSLRKLYNECHIPVENREILPVAADDCGVIWVCGIGVDQRICVDGDTKKVLVFNYDIIKS